MLDVKEDVYIEGRVGEQRGHSKNEELKKARFRSRGTRGPGAREAREVDENLTYGFTAHVRALDFLP